ncbi:MAG: ribonuclease Y [Candidatus Latescibacterota bacterium]|jgi:ribonuclease Y
MSVNWLPLAIGVLAAFFGYLVGYLFNRRVLSSHLEEARTLSTQMIEDARKTAENCKKESELEAKNTFLQMKVQFEEETKNKREKISEIEAKLEEKESNLKRKLNFLNRKEASLDEKHQAVETKEKVLDGRITESNRLIAEQNVRLERIAGMRKEEAKRVLLKNLEDEARMEAAKRAREIREKAERDAEREAKKIISLAIQRYAAEQSVETTVSVVDLPSDDMKGRIIGREGRNIRAFEMATGVDVIIDDTPEAVIISGFDPVRREIARLSLEKLVQDGRIHPGRIEELVARTREEIEGKIRETGEQACMDLGINSIDPEMVELVGKMKYRSSYGQNCLSHSMEVAYVAGIIAAELNLDEQIARRAGLLHDIGKVASHEAEGSHTEIGADLARKFGESEDVINAVRAHHGDVEATSLYTAIVGAADAVSGARPGARRESLEAYVKRLAKLEEIADGFKGVEKSYAIQAGREIRIMVSNKQVNDEGAAELAYNVSRKLEKELDYPGQIRVVVIRETRAVEFAR